MRKFSSFLLYTDGRWDYNPHTPGLSEVQIHLIDSNKGIGFIKMNHRITIELFGRENTVILPILTHPQYEEYNRISTKLIHDTQKKMEIHQQWFSSVSG